MQDATRKSINGSFVCITPSRGGNFQKPEGTIMHQRRPTYQSRICNVLSKAITSPARREMKALILLKGKND